MPQLRPAFVVALSIVAVAFTAASGQPAGSRPRNVILITLDGARTQEIFGGLDLDVLRSVTKKGTTVQETPIYKRYWAQTPEQRRAKLLPFLWQEWMRHGSIAGNRAKGSRFSVTNRHRFSYPGYSEIVTGEAHDSTIDSNDNRRYPYLSVFEFLKARWSLPRERAAVFGSWETFNWIAEREEGALTINAGYEAVDGAAGDVARLSASQFETQSPWDTVRFDMYTFRLAMAHLATARPRVLYLALGETDDWAHDKRYDRVLQTLERTDGYFRELWTWLQNDPDYRDNTAILITVDHGRGRTADDWSGHGDDVAGADETWLAAIGPDWPRRGEWTSAPDAFANQIAATLARAAGEDYSTAVPGAGKPIDYLWGK